MSTKLLSRGVYDEGSSFIIPFKSNDSQSRNEKFMSYFVYILECADKSLYVGCTNDLNKRLKQHNDSKWGAHYTKIRRPVKLVYSENFKTKSEALKREAQIKSWRREKKLDLY